MSTSNMFVHQATTSPTAPTSKRSARRARHSTPSSTSSSSLSTFGETLRDLAGDSSPASEALSLTDEDDFGMGEGDESGYALEELDDAWDFVPKVGRNP